MISPRKTLPLLFCAILTLAFGTTASADTITYQIIFGNNALDPYDAPYAQVDVNRTDSTHATVTFTSLATNGFIFLMGTADVAGVNINATSFTVSNIVAANYGSGFNNPPGPYTVGSGNSSEFGNFNMTLKTTGGFKNTATSISFDLLNTSGGSWLTAGSVLVSNDKGYLAEIHGFVTEGPPVKSNGVLVTGFAANGPPTQRVPDGGMTLSLLGMAMAGLGLIARRVKK